VSRFELDQTTVRETLGNIENVMLVSSSKLEERINQLDLDHQSQPIQHNND